jgi:hypothetical protein
LSAAVDDADYWSSHEFQNYYQVTRRTMRAVLRAWPKRTVAWVDFKSAVYHTVEKTAFHSSRTLGGIIAAPEILNDIVKRISAFFAENAFDWPPTASIADVLSGEDLEMVRGCLRAAVEGDFFPEWEFRTIFGVKRAVVRTVFNAWPKCTVAREDFKRAVCNSLSHLVFYPHHMEDKLPASPEIIVATLDRLMPFFGERKLRQRRIPFLF